VSRSTGLSDEGVQICARLLYNTSVSGRGKKVQIELAKRADDELMLLCRHGREDAFRELYHRYRQRIINFAWQMLRDRDAAADALQETFQYLFRKIPDYRAEGKLSVLLYRAARSICLNRLKKNRGGKELPLEEDAVVPVEVGNAGAPLEHQEIRAKVSEALGKLPAIYSEVIILRMLNGLPVAEVAEISGCPEGTVKSRLHNGLELMRKMLKGSDLD
jgi:RNA polymerase sigma-70 factor (ECF subfamily)